MAAKRGGESRTGLVVFLVLFILVSIGLGVTTYYGYEEANNQKKAAEEKAKETKAMTTDKDYWKFLALTYRAYIGLPATKDDLQIFKTLRDQYVSGGEIAKAHDDSSADHKKTITEDWGEKSAKKWDAGNAKPAVTYIDEINTLKEQLNTKDKALKAAEEGVKQKDEELKTSNNLLTKAKLDFENELRNRDTKNTGELKIKDATILQLQDQLNKKLDPKLVELDNQKKEIDVVKKENDRLAAQLKEAIKTAKKSQEELAAVRATAEEIDISKVNPDNLATITYINRAGDMPYISLGSADNLRRQVTFSIYGKGVDGRPLKDPKGKIEVVRITGEHQAQAQITELRDERRDPVLPGDFIYNPAWNPNLKQHVALVGLIDLTGQGRDSTQELIRTLRNQNVEVDAFMDLKPPFKLRKPDGGEAEITRNIDMVIVGTSPALPGGGAPRIGGDKGDPNKDMLEAMDKYQRRADQLGVRVIRLNNFLEMSGYPLPKTSPEAGKINFHKTLESVGSPVKPPVPPK